jgi:hypothetical protein
LRSTIPTQAEYDEAKRNEARRTLGFPLSVLGPDILREAAAMSSVMGMFHESIRIGPSEYTVFSRMGDEQKSHYGKPENYVKPFGVRTKGYKSTEA